jgi:flagellum-specific peptidoglycan hydrolase FlgJ
MTPTEHTFLSLAFAAAEKCGHVFPEMAACEAALESDYGRSVLASVYNNLFGCKQHQHPVYGTHVLPTRECLDGKWVALNSSWIVYPDWAACFGDRMATLKRLASVYPHYAAALAAQSPLEYLSEVSQTWSTDPQRAAKVQAIYDAVAGDWNAT